MRERARRFAFRVLQASELGSRYARVVSRRALSAALLVASVLAVVIAWQMRERAAPPLEAPRAATARATTRLDLPAYRAQQLRLAEGIKRISISMAKRPVSRDASVDAVRSAARALFSAFDPCDLGIDICASIYAIGEDCVDGDAETCLALGQFLAGTPPHPMVAIMFFFAACRGGVAEACAKLDEAKQPMNRPCRDDPFVCATAAGRARDAPRLHEACTLGVADACLTLTLIDEDPSHERGYIERACQLGTPRACLELAARLRPGCQPGPQRNCYPPDEAQAAAAREIGCLGMPNHEDCKQ